ncbi:energy-coupling factor transporter transmembrane component T family protein [Demequina flava]|uniref:energy-coupling factor transporter transmembrane component T family protein n=1 Tax=Demequina flava TaxID=1095025 RepID=UPI00078076B7|nr:energy-coupling factor transporter transmembrane protein EcfT [Demequina flava]
MISTLGLYRPRDTPLHRAPAWFKVSLLVATTIVVLVSSDIVTSLGIMCAALLLLVSTVPPAKVTLWTIAGTVLIALLSSALFMWRGDWLRAADVVADLVAIVSLALAVSTSTSMAAMLDFIATLARPIRAILPPDTLGLMFALMLRALPEVAQIYAESRQAARARGLDRSLRAVLFPTTTRTVGFALDLGQAIHARGIGEESDATHEARSKRERRRAKKAEKTAKRLRGRGRRRGPAVTQQAPPDSGDSPADSAPEGATGEDTMTKEEAFERLLGPQSSDK